MPCPATAANLLANSSFELGIDHRYAVGRWYLNGLPNLRLDDKVKVHGRVSLRAPFAPRGTAKDSPNSIELRSGAAVKVEAGHTYTFSVYLKTDVPDADASIALSRHPPYGKTKDLRAEKKITLGRQYTPQGFEFPWVRHEISYRAEKSERLYWIIFVNSKRTGTLWVDALQLEEGPLHDYAPRLDVEAGLIDATVGHIHDPGKPPEVTLNSYNDGAAPARRRVGLRILDEADKVVSERTIEVTTPANGQASRRIALDVGGANGYFVAQLIMPDEDRDYVQETLFTVLPKPRPIAPKESAFGAYVTPAEEGLRVLSRAGFHWTGTLTAANYMGTWWRVERKPGEFVWRDEEVALYRRYGFEIMLNMVGWAAPKWLRNKSVAERTEGFARYVDAALRHYRGKIRYFAFTDEIHNKVPGSRMLGRRKALWSNPAEYAAWHKIAYAAAKRANPDARIVLNTQLGAFGPEELFRELSPKMVDVLAGNYYPYPGAVRKMKQAGDDAGVSRFWAPGVGVITWPHYYRRDRPQRVGTPAYLETMIRKLIRSFGNGAEKFFHYTATYVGNTDVYSLYEHDSSLRTNGAQFAALAWLLDGFEKVRKVPLARASKVDAYRFDRRDGQTVFALWSEIDSGEQSLLFKHPIQNARVYDRWTNDRTPATQGGLERLALGRESRFLLVPTQDADAVEQVVGMARFKLGSLPETESVERAGRYAVLSKPVRHGRKKKIVSSIWYESASVGWRKLLEIDDKDSVRVAVTPAGGDVHFSYDWNGGVHHLFLGSLAPELWGARFWRSIESRGHTVWQSGVIDPQGKPKSAVGASDSSAPSVAAPLPPAYVIDLGGGEWLTIATDGEQPNLRYPTSGAWNLFASGAGREPPRVSIRRYVHAGTAHHRNIRVRVSVVRSER